jgi:aspartate/methionine/tyrosine aminotransferase
MTTATPSAPVSARTPTLQTKLPAVGTNIFTVMSALATENNAVNLGQGFPDFECDPQLVVAVTDAMTRGLNQYPPMTGVPVLRQAVADKLQKLHARNYDANTEITITAGATQAIITAILAVVHAGDEVIVLEPCYDSYVPNIELAGTFDTRYLQARLRPHRWRHHAKDTRHHHQLTAQPKCHRLDTCRHVAAAGHSGTHGSATDQR